jgi:hypothetical protein
VHQLHADARHRDRHLVAGECFGRRDVAIATAAWRKLRSDARVDAQIFGKRWTTELVAAVSSGPPEVSEVLGSLRHQQCMRVDVRPIRAGEHTGAAEVIGMMVRVDDRAHRLGRYFVELGFDGARVADAAEGVHDDQPVGAFDLDRVAQ